MLKERYGSPRLNNKDDPLDELFFIILSQMTTGPSYERVFDRLKQEIPDWRHLSEIPAGRVASVISDAGLSNQKAPRMLAIARKLKADFGEVILDPIKNMDDEAAERYLTSLPGVGVKTAKCVLMFSLARKVLPVDTHVARVAKRLELIAADTPSARLHRDLESVVSPDLRFDFHVNSLALGRDSCRAAHPRCLSCCLSTICPSARTWR